MIYINLLNNSKVAVSHFRYENTLAKPYPAIDTTGESILFRSPRKSLLTVWSS